MVSNERPDDEMLVRYLVGTTTDEETEALDELSIVDEAFAERLRAAEHDLVDAYASGELSVVARGPRQSRHRQDSSCVSRHASRCPPPGSSRAGRHDVAFPRVVVRRCSSLACDRCHARVGRSAT